MDDIDKLFDCFTSDAPEEPETMSIELEPGEITEKTTPDRRKRKLDDDEPVEQKKFKLNDDPVRETSETQKDSEIPDVSAPTKDAKQETPKEIIDEATEDAMKHKANVDLNLDDLDSKKFHTRIDVHKIEAPESCFHEVAVHPGGEFIPLTANTGAPAKKYAFVLDSFQKESILCIDNNQSVLVSAHTSAGKTVVAEYAIAVSLKNKQRVIYTTPIKALSNQKYREFSTEFKDVGLVTGDVTINPSASCLIMTTEILRNMLYRGSEIMREVGWVVFDEIHYMRDKERGVVWEETLILLPHNVRFVFLSATIPNARQFAEWVCYLHQQPCHVVYTDYRPTPLQHFIFPAGGTGIHMVVDETGAFKEENFNAAMAVLQNAGEAAKGDQKGRKGGVRGQNPATTNIFKIVKMIMERNFAPVIVFSFSKKDCELYAMQMSKLDFNSASERLLVDEVFQNAMAILSEADRNLPQVLNLLPLLRRGVGIHHGGLLPILKETIEILFGEGLIKALFATETFAMGLNMPARTVLFTGSRKFDGTDMRWITSGEYIQMSGRAGRRGIDDKGIVILMIDEKVPAAIGREIVKGQPDPINSAFHLTYNMVLNLLRVEEVNPEYMLERSFYQFQNQLALPDLHADFVKLTNEYNAIEINNEEEVSTYYSIRQQLNTLGVQFQGYLTKPQYLVPFLQPGRLVKIKYEKDEYDWGIILSFKRVAEKNKKGAPANPTTSESKVMIDILLNVLEEDNDKSRTIPKPGPLNKPGLILAVPVASQYLTTISSVRVCFPDDLRPPENRLTVYKTISEVKKRFPQGPPLLNPIKDMNIKDTEFKDICQRIEKLEKRMFAHSLHNNPMLDTEYPKYEKKIEIDAQVKVAKQKFLEAKSVLQLDELKSRKRVLRRMNYCSNTDVIALKGRVACELSSADELLLTELIFNGTFGQLNPSQCAALLSCFVCDEKSNDNMKLAEELSGSLRTMQDLARRIAKVSVEARLQIDEETYVDRFKPYLMDVVHSWCNGVTFAELCNMTDIFEGSIIRCMRRLEELLRQMCQAAKTIGNSELEDKFSTGIKLLKRDIIFAASLYL